VIALTTAFVQSHLEWQCAREGAIMRIHFMTLAVSAVIAGFSGTAKASNVTSFNPQSVILALQNAGYNATLEKTDDGDPIIDTASDGNTIRIGLTDCKDHNSCGTSEFIGILDCSDLVEKCKKVVIDTNNDESPVHVLPTNNGKTAITYLYLLYDDAGISEKLFVKNFETFIHYNNQFTATVAKK
jgi:hypothetical protein